MIRTSILSIALVATALAASASAQLQVIGGDSERMSSMALFWDNGPAGMVCIQYGQPEWKPSYEGMINQLEDKQLRLGKDFWTTLNTTKALTIGGTKVPAGSYYLGLKCDKDRLFHLVVLRAEKADEKGWTPFIADEWKPEILCPMDHGKVEDPVAKMRIAIEEDSAEDPTKRMLTITWGAHQLVAPLVVHLDGGSEEVEEIVEEAVLEDVTPASGTKKK